MTWHTALAWFLGLSFGRQAALVLLTADVVWLAWRTLADSEERDARARWFKKYREENPK